MFKGEWTYETGEEISEIFGSGSRYENIYRTDNFEDALLQYGKLSRNYLVRKQFKDKKMIREVYNPLKKVFESN